MISDDKLISAVRKRHARDRELKVGRVMQESFGGDLVTIDVYQDNLRVAESYVLVTGNTIQKTFYNLEELLAWQMRGSGNFFAFERITAIIALIMVLLIGAIVIFNLTQNAKIEVPEILGNALTTILGFYFGSQVRSGTDSSSRKKASPDSDSNTG